MRVLSRLSDLQLSFVAILHSSYVITQSNSSEDFQMFPSRHAIVGQSADPFIMLSSRCDDAFDGINEFRLVTSSGT